MIKFVLILNVANRARTTKFHCERISFVQAATQATITAMMSERTEGNVTRTAVEQKNCPHEQGWRKGCFCFFN